MVRYFRNIYFNKQNSVLQELLRVQHTITPNIRQRYQDAYDKYELTWHLLNAFNNFYILFAFTHLLLATSPELVNYIRIGYKFGSFPMVLVWVLMTIYMGYEQTKEWAEPDPWYFGNGKGSASESMVQLFMKIGESKFGSIIWKYTHTKSLKPKNFTGYSIHFRAWCLAASLLPLIIL